MEKTAPPQDMATNPKFIARADNITAQWLETALARQIPGVAVTEFERLDNIVGAQTKVRVKISTNEAGRAARLPERLIVKADIEEFGRGPVANVLFNEPRVYRDIIPSLGVEAPRVFAAEPGDNGPSYTVMEDLTERDVQFLYLGNPLTPDVAARFLESLAKIHARWWNAPEIADKGRFGAIRQPMIGMFETYVRHHLSPEVFPHFAALPRAAATPVPLRDPERLQAALFRLRDCHQSMPRCLIHGDTHLNNLYLTADGVPGFYDWSPRRAPWSNDIAYFMPAALDVTDRRVSEKDLLAHYLSALAGEGVAAPTFDEAWLAYRRELAWGMFVFLINGPTQTEYSNTAAASRFAAAMLDHETFSLLGV